MAKKIDRARIDSGRFELPKKLAFLLSEKVDFSSITDTDGDWSVQVSAAALQRLVKSKAELKTLKAENKTIANAQASVLATEKAAHEESQKALASATRKVKLLEKKLASATVVAVAPAAAPVPETKAKAVVVQVSSGKAIGNGAPPAKPSNAKKAAQATKAAATTKATPTVAPVTETKTQATSDAVATPASSVSKVGSAKPAAKVVKKAPKKAPKVVTGEIKVVAAAASSEPAAFSADVIAAPSTGTEIKQPTEAAAAN